MSLPLGILGLDVAELVEDAVRALVDLIVPDFGADWVSRLVTWLVALPPVTGSAFPSLNAYATQLTAVGFGILGATFIGGLLQLWAGGAGGALRAGEAAKRAAIAAGALAFYPTVLGSVLVGVNVLTHQMVGHPRVVDGLDKAFGEALAVAAVTGGISLGLAVGAAVAVLYFVAALFVLKIGLTAVLAATMIGGALVWGLYPLPQAQWLPRAWVSALAAALTIPVAWACIFAAAALLARDALVFDGGSSFNNPLGDVMAYLVKPFAAVACFWIAYRAPYFLVGLARAAGITAGMMSGDGRSGEHGGRSAEFTVRRGVQTNADRFRALATRSRGAQPAAAAPAAAAAAAPRGPSRVARAAVTAPKRANDWWRSLPAEGGAKRLEGETPPRPRRTSGGSPEGPAPKATRKPHAKTPTAAAAPPKQPIAAKPASPSQKPTPPKPKTTTSRTKATAAQPKPARAPKSSPAKPSVASTARKPSTPKAEPAPPAAKPPARPAKRKPPTPKPTPKKKS